MLLSSYPRTLAHMVDRIENGKVILKAEATEKDYEELKRYQEWYQEQQKHPWHDPVIILDGDEEEILFLQGSLD